MSETFMTVSEVAAILAVTPQSIRNLCDRGVLKCIRPLGPRSCRRILRSSFEAYLADLQIEVEPEEDELALIDEAIGG